MSADRLTMRFLARLVLKLLLRVRVLGDLTPFEQSNRVLVVANHLTRFDAFVLGLFLPRQPVVVVPPDDLRSPAWRRLMRLVPHVALDVNNPAAIRRLLRLLRSNRPLVLFPEGRLNAAEGVMKVYPTPALIGLKSGATVVPVQIEGNGECLSRSGRPSLLSRVLPAITLRIQAATRIDGGPTRSGRRRRAYATRRLSLILQSMSLTSHAGKPIFHCFLDAIAVHGRRRLLIEDQSEEPRSYGFLLKGSLAISRWIRRHSAPRENVGLLLPNVIASVCAVLGVSAAGRVPAIFNYTSGPLGVKSAAIAAGVRTVVTSRKFIEQARLEPLIEALVDCRLFYLEDIRGQFRLLDKLWLMLFALRFPRWAIERQSNLDPAVVLFTSGSEDRPKGVVLSHHAVVANVAQMRAVFDFTADDKVLNPLPIYHAYSFTAGMILSLITGTRLFLYVSPLRYRAIPEIAYRRDCTILFGTSTFLSYYARHADPMDFRRLRYVISGGEKLAPEVARTWLEKFGLRIYEGYGATEAAPVIALATPGSFRRGSVGRFLPGIDYALEIVEGIEKGAVLHVRGPNLMLGYYRYANPGQLEPPKSSFGEGWYNTGDVVELDADEFVRICGRAKRFAKIAGEMISLDVIEQVARQASPEADHAAVLLAQDFSGETTVLFTTDAKLSRGQLADAARSLGTHDLSVARRIIHIPEMPLLATGKTDYVGLQALLEDDTFTRLLTAAGAHPEPAKPAALPATAAPPNVNR
jgi:acyl-[acyl-carrier-protein]-phospholipid O-acyltransferase/long-chain-fatty-acid--[acyl-carrier-protein] ligase